MNTVSQAICSSPHPPIQQLTIQGSNICTIDKNQKELTGNIPLPSESPGLLESQPSPGRFSLSWSD